METIDSDCSDAGLVAASLRGNREAFGRIVERYQTLICSIAYSATGNLARSEDLAQETFITAWRELDRLREPGKIREWLSGIARNLTRNAYRRERREPSLAAEPLESAGRTAVENPSPTEEAISREEQAILWRALEKLPELYREPLVLFYRQNQNIPQVAGELNLTEDAVKQRLARGRKLLQAEVQGFVESALTRSSPGRGFALGVIAALPILPVSATAATVGATAAKGSATAGAMNILGGLAALSGPIIGVLGAWLGVRASLAQAQSVRERQFIIRSAVWSSAGVLTFLLLLTGILLGARHHWQSHGPQIAIALAVLVILYVLALLISVHLLNGRLRKIQLEQSAAKAPMPNSLPHSFRREYRSRLTLFGWPLIHLNVGAGPGGKHAVARGWLAIGDTAVGLVAFGGTALGAVAIGGAATGLLSFGGAAVGAFAFGGLAIGWYSIGGMAIGVEAAGGCALALKTAFGGAAFALENAVGGMVSAPHANDTTARSIVEASTFFAWAKWTAEHSRHLSWLSLLPLVLTYKAFRKSQPNSGHPTRGN